MLKFRLPKAAMELVVIFCRGYTIFVVTGKFFLKIV